MMTAQETKKIGIVVIVLVILLVGILVMRQQRRLPESVSTTNTTSQADINYEEATPTIIKEIPPGIYTIELEPKNIRVGEETSAGISFTAKDKNVTGTDIVLRFNPEFLEAGESIVTSDYFSNYPRREVNNKDGLIKVTGFSPVNGSVEDRTVNVFTVKFKGKKGGSTKISFDFELGKTNMTNIVEKGTSKNILGQVREAIVLIEP